MELTVNKVWYLHKMQGHQEYGGPEEGGWYYDVRYPLRPDHWGYEPPRIFTDEEEAFAACRWCYAAEYERRKKEEPYDYYSVLSDQSTFFEYDVTDDPTPHTVPEHRPHYE